MLRPIVTAFFDRATSTYSYVVQDPESKHAAIVDSVLDFDYASGTTSTASAERILEFVNAGKLTVDWILETHVHADHLSAAPFLKQHTGAPIAIGSKIIAVQETFGNAFNAEKEFARDGSQFDRLLEDGNVIEIGNLRGKAVHTPGHTPACMTYVFGDAAFVGDTLFMPDYGTARCDFPGGDARQLYHSIQRLYMLPDETRLFMCHDYKAPGRDEHLYQTSVAEQRWQNIHAGEGVSEDDFVEMRTTRDATLEMPNLMLPSVQVNMRSGQFPPPEANGQVYLKVPINLFQRD